VFLLLLEMAWLNFSKRSRGHGKSTIREYYAWPLFYFIFISFFAKYFFLSAVFSEYRPELDRLTNEKVSCS